MKKRMKLQKTQKKYIWIIAIIVLIAVIVLAAYPKLTGNVAFGYFPSNFSCSDPDGYNINTKTTLTYSYFAYRTTVINTYTDKCLGNSTLLEFYCDNKVGSKILICAYGCVDGACTSQTLIGNLNVISIPSSASLYVDSIYKGLTPMLVSNLIAGNHSIKLTKSGYNNYTTTRYIYAGQTTSLNIALV